MGDVDDPLFTLLDAAREGDDRALTELVRRTQPAVWRLCRSLSSVDDVEDVVQDVYLRAVKALDRFRGDSPVLPWLLSIGRHTCADHVRRKQRQQRLVERLEAAAHVSPAHAVAPAIAPPIDELLDGLDTGRREAFVLTQVVGLSYEEAARAVGCPIGTIRSRVARARADLAAMIPDSGIAHTG